MKGGVKCCNWGLQERTPHPLGTRRSTTSGPFCQWIVAFKYSPRRLCRTFLQEKTKQKQKHSCTARILSPPRYTSLFKFPGILARRIRLFVGGFPPKTESVFFKSFRFGMAVHEHKPTWQKKPSSQFSLDGQDWIPKESNSNHHQKAFWNSEIYFDWIHWIIIAFSTCLFIKDLSRCFSHLE